jgi:sugar phosphate permease
MVLDEELRQRRQGAASSRARPGARVTPAKPPYRWTILSVGVVTTAAISALRQGLPSLGPALRDRYDLSLTQTGMVFSSVTLGIVLTLFAWGVVTDRRGERLVLSVGLAGAAAGLVAAAFASGYYGLLAGLMGAGMLGASATNASGRAVMGWFPRSERGMALGVRQMAVPLGGGVAAIALPVIAGAGGIRAAMLALAAGCVAGALTAARWMREPPPAPPGTPVVNAPAPQRDPRLWRLGAGSALLVTAQSGILAFVVVYLHEERGLSVLAAAATLASMQLAGAVARVAVGRWSDRRDARVDPIRRLGLAAAAVLALAALLAATAPTVALVPVLALAGALAMSWNGLAFTAAAEMSGRDRAGSAIGIQNTILSLAGVFAPVGFAALAGGVSWPVAYAALAVSQVAGWRVLGPLVADEDRRRAVRQRRLRTHAAARRPARPRRPADPGTVSSKRRAAAVIRTLEGEKT